MNIEKLRDVVKENEAVRRRSRLSNSERTSEPTAGKEFETVRRMNSEREPE